MSKQFEQLEMLYKQILYLSQEVSNNIDKSDYDEILSIENSKSQLVSRVMLAQKTVTLSEAENEIILSLRSKIAENEKNNLDIIKDLRDKTLEELKAVNNQSKISNKYVLSEEPMEDTGTICDYTSD